MVHVRVHVSFKQLTSCLFLWAVPAIQGLLVHLNIVVVHILLDFHYVLYLNALGVA